MPQLKTMTNMCLPLGICRQPWQPIPRDLSQERQQRRASFLNHGPPNQGENGHYDREQQANSASRGRARGAIGIGRGLLLDNFLVRSVALKRTG